MPGNINARDNMAKIPEPENSVGALIDKAHEMNREPPRPHMGCSLLGHKCDRWLWLSFRWAVQPQFTGRMLRLFRRGQNEEKTIVSDLRKIGVDVVNTGDDQSRVDFGSHVSGSIDGIIKSGVPEAPNKRHVLECKTHNLKSFNELEKNGVERAKPMHYIQMQVYMHGTGTDRALYFAVCKDDDRIYTERVRYNKELAERAIERGKRIALSDKMPEPISTDPSWYECKFCDAYDFCHGSKTTKHTNCRTCAHATAKSDGTWRCERFDADDIPLDFQRKGCNEHIIHPDLVPWELKESSTEDTVVYVINGKDVINGNPENGAYNSREILANPDACASGNDYVNAIRDEFDGRIVK